MDSEIEVEYNLKLLMQAHLDLEKAHSRQL
jgi:hypothetical protein